MAQTHQGFVGNVLLSDGKIATAIGGQFNGGYTVLHIDKLTPKVEGKDLFLDTNLKALIGYKSELEQGKQVNVHIEWTLNEDRRDYTSAKLLSVEVVEKTN